MTTPSTDVHASHTHDDGTVPSVAAASNTVAASPGATADVDGTSATATDRRVIRVNGPHPYEVTIGTGLTADIVAEASRYATVCLVHQPSIKLHAYALLDALTAAKINAHAIEIPDAEEGKTFASLQFIWDELARHGMTRRDAIIGLGGGAVTDVAGFAAASWMRGIDVIQVPTTVLAMVDAAVGGKTGINTPAGKNLVGAFHEPRAVYIDLSYARTLPRDEITAGSAEIIKTGFIADPDILRLYEDNPAACLDVDGTLPELVYRSVAVKARVVGEDLTEAGLREILNYGHTFGHAVERRENYQWRHGRAVAVGMVFEAELARLTGHLSAEDVQRHRTILSSVGLPTTYEQGAFEELLDGMSHDKKNRDGAIRFVILDDIAEPTRLNGPDQDVLRAAYAAIAPAAA